MMQPATKKRRLTPAAAEKKAASYIQAENPYAQEACRYLGQDFDNCKDTQWLVGIVAARLLVDDSGEYGNIW